MRLSLFIAALLLCGQAVGQTVTMPQSVPVAVNRLAAVEITYDGDAFDYIVPPELDAFREFTTDAKVVKLRVIGYQAGTFRIVAVAAKTVDGKAKLSPFNSCLVIVGGSPTPPVPPTPVPPTPVPPVPPEPTPPNPPIAGPRQLLIFRESAEDTPAQGRMFTSLQAGQASTYLKGKGHVCFVLDVDAKDADGNPSPLIKSWSPQIAGMSLPALVLVDKASGKIVHKVSLPKEASADDVLTVLKANGG